MKRLLLLLNSFLCIMFITPFFVIGILMGFIWIGLTAGIQTSRDITANKGYL